MGVYMQPASHDDTLRQEVSSQQWVERTVARPDVYAEQEDQWAVLRHEVEVEDMQKYNEPVRSNREQRNTGDDELFITPDQQTHHVDIVVVGVGGGGMNAINRMISTRVRGVRFIAMNTDAQVLNLSAAQNRICLGEHQTKGLGAGGNAALGMRAATESDTEIRTALGEPDLVFIAAGMGGGTGTGAAPVVASIARKLGALTIGIVTLPFTFEGTRRRRVADEGLEELSTQIDALITVPNDRLLASIGRERGLHEAFQVADDVLRQGVQGIAEVINVPGMINVDFADVRSVLNEAGTALMSIGRGQGVHRAQQAAEEAIAGGFLNVSIRGAKRVLFNISGGEDMTLFEVNEVAERIGAAIDSSADITFGAVIDPTLKDALRVTLIAAGMEERSTVRMSAIQVNASNPTGGRELQPKQRPVAPAAPSHVLATPKPATPAARPAGYDERPQHEATNPGTLPLPARRPQSPPQPSPVRPTLPPGRQQRSLDDLRGIRSMGQRHDAIRRRQTGEDEAEEMVDIPPFMKRPQGT